MVNLYIACTGYHILLSMAISASHPQDDNFMIIPNSTQGLLELPKLFPGNNMKILSFERKTVNSNIKEFFLKKHNLKILEKMVKSLPTIDRIYYIQEWHVYTTYTVHLAGKINPSVEFNFVEDGVYTYVEENKKRKNRAERLLDKLFYGSWHSSVGVPGTLRRNSSLYALSPELLPDIYEQKRQVKINLASLMEQIDEDLLADMTHTQRDDDDIDTLIALDSNYKYTGSNEYKNTIVSCIKENSTQNTKAAIKRHPADYSGVSFIPSGYQTKDLFAGVPIELFYLRYRESLRKIVGGLSTALFTARYMLPGVEIESIVSKKDLAQEENSETILKVFSSMGVKIRIIE